MGRVTSPSSSPYPDPSSARVRCRRRTLHEMRAAAESSGAAASALRATMVSSASHKGNNDWPLFAEAPLIAASAAATLPRSTAASMKRRSLLKNESPMSAGDCANGYATMKNGERTPVPTRAAFLAGPSSSSSPGAACSSSASLVLVDSSSGTAETPAAVTCAASTIAAIPPFRNIDSYKARRVRFYRNGDQYFKGVDVAISSERFRSFASLLEELTRSLADLVNLPHGVRQIFSLDGQSRVADLDQLRDGEGYVCSSTETYKRIDYENAREPLWSYALPRFNGAVESAALALDNRPVVQEPNDFVYPRIITVIRNGVKPRRVIRHLLNKKTARHFNQVMADITTAIKLDSGVVRKVFSLNGKAVVSLADFFGEDDVFIAYGNERMGADDFYVVSEECKTLYSARGGATRRRRGLDAALPLQRRHLPARNESLREQRGTSLLQGREEMSRTLPLLLDDRMQIVRLLGDGNTALVYETVCKRTKEHKALKVISRENSAGKESLIEGEIAVLQRISHAHIVELHEYWLLDGAYYLSMELVPGGDLFEHLCTRRHFGECESAGMLRCLVAALDYLHGSDIIHRDVKPENLLIYVDVSTGASQLKLADFGLAIECTEPQYVICGTPTYVAPEILAQFGYGTKVDIWAAGVILYVMLCGFPPFQSVDGNQEQLFGQILRGKYTFPSPAWTAISYSAKALIQAMLQLDVADRFSAEQILEHPWITGRGTVDAEFEQLSEAVVKAYFTSESRRDHQQLEETDREYVYSRRASMDELSECCTLGGRSDGGAGAINNGDRECSFEFYSHH